MSTSFEVIPGKKKTPTFEQVLKLAESRFCEFLDSISKEVRYDIRLERRNQDTKIQSENYNLKDTFTWREEEYLWLSVKEKAGGAEIYCWNVEEDERDFWEKEINANKKSDTLAEKIYECLDNGVYWNICREGTNDPVVDVLYGYFAAALAELTDGIIFSSDNAWDNECFPAIAEEFYTWYFRPDKAISNEIKDWSEASLSMLI